MCFFFFFKQKTAYEMRISDWSSDVCSSDLREDVDALQPAVARVVEHLAHGGAGDHHAHRDVDLGLEHGSLEDRRFQAVAGLAAAEVQADGPVAVTRAGGLRLGVRRQGAGGPESGRDRVYTPVTTAHHVC